MKGLVIFDERANLSFYSLDKEMEAYISNRMQELEKTAGASVSRQLVSISQSQFGERCGHVNQAIAQPMCHTYFIAVRKCC